MIISIIGMSGSGKTHWSKKLKDQGFSYIGCDDLIEDKLCPELSNLGYKGVNDVAKWLGQPHEPQFKQNQDKFIQFETEVMQEILWQIKNNSFGHRVSKNKKTKNIVVDTTGSLIYTSHEVCYNLQQHTIVVHLKVSQSIHKFMLQQYIGDPKPVVWGNNFIKKNNETNECALRRCYPELLQYRDNLYEKYARITLDAGELRSSNFTIDDFLKAINIKV